MNQFLCPHDVWISNGANPQPGPQPSSPPVKWEHVTSSLPTPATQFEPATEPESEIDAPSIGMHEIVVMTVGGCLGCCFICVVSGFVLYRSQMTANDLRMMAVNIDADRSRNGLREPASNGLREPASNGLNGHHEMRVENGGHSERSAVEMGNLESNGMNGHSRNGLNVAGSLHSERRAVELKGSSNAVCK